MFNGPLLPAAFALDRDQRQHVIGRHPRQPLEVDHEWGHVAKQEDWGRRASVRVSRCVCSSHICAGAHLFDNDRLVTGCVAWRMYHTQVAGDLCIAVKQYQHTLFVQRHKILGKVGITRALVCVCRVVILDALDNIAGVWEGRDSGEAVERVCA